MLLQDLRDEVGDALGVCSSCRILCEVLDPRTRARSDDGDANAQQDTLRFECRKFHWVLQRCKLVNSVGGPRQLCVHWSSIKRLGRIPRWPDDAAHILDYERVLEAWVERMDEFGKIGDRATAPG